MDLAFIEYHPQRVLDAFRQGEFDALEILGQADERDFFERCFKERLLPQLAQDMPTRCQKEEVPRWFILAANLSLKLHQENSFLAFERVVRCGGLLAALPPDLATKHLDPQTQRWVLSCQGFNDKNRYDRTTPCDQDTLRKARKRVPAAQWLEWLNTTVQNWGIDVLIPMKKNMDIWADAWALAPQGAWQRRPEPAPSVPQIPPQRPELIRRREAKRQQKLAQYASTI